MSSKGKSKAPAKKKNSRKPKPPDKGSPDPAVGRQTLWAAVGALVVTLGVILAVAWRQG